MIYSEILDFTLISVLPQKLDQLPSISQPRSMGMHCSRNKEGKQYNTLTIDQFKPAAEFLDKTVNSYFLYFIGKFGNRSFHIQT